MLQDINIKDLSNLISEKTGYFVNFSFTVSGEKLIVNSQELKEQAGITSCLYSTLRIKNFNGGITGDNKAYWLPLNFSFEYASGGYNGTEFVVALYNFKNKKWTLRY
jgi:hypothetical protein